MNRDTLNTTADHVSAATFSRPLAEWPDALREEISRLPAESRDLVLTAAAIRVLESEKGACSYPVWYATNRRPISTGGLYSSKRTSPAQVSYGICDVTIPQSHNIGSTGIPWWKQLIKRPDGKLKIRAHTTLDESTFWGMARERLSGIPENNRGALVFIHGFNVKFSSAALRAAQLGVDLKVPLTAFFSWPSKGSFLKYGADAAAIEWSETMICGFLKGFLSKSGARHVHIIAHSMGNRGLLDSFRTIANDIVVLGTDRFGHIILAAPDVDSGTFANHAGAYPVASRRTTMYVSRNDRALTASGFIYGASRAGFVPPVTIVQGIDTVEVSAVDISRLGHGYFAAARPLLSDIHAVIHSDQAPATRIGLISAQDNGKTYWRFQA